jgi:glycerol-3-phosphate dehydrogenase
MSDSPLYDLAIIGGGVNGAGIARDAAGRGLKVLLAEQNDLASATSSASSKLIHGGLRYLEHYEFRLVREALGERDVLLRNAPHIIWPLSFVLPVIADMRPPWLLRLGLLLYDNLAWSPGARKSMLPRSRGVDLHAPPFRGSLKDGFSRGFSYADCWVDDARLVVLNARDAADRGARILTRTRVTRAERGAESWRVSLRDEDGHEETIAARVVVNAAGPWAGDVLGGALGVNATATLRLIKGSHIVVRRLWAEDHAFILQNDDKRVVFAIPYERSYTLIGTTDVPYGATPGAVTIDAEEIAYLCRAANRYVAQEITPADVVWSYAGVRPLYDDGKDDASAVTRDYVLHLHGAPAQPPVLSVFGGKITTFRRLAEHALEKVRAFLPRMGARWTHATPLPGGDIADADFDAFLVERRRAAPWMPEAHLHGLARRHGTRVAKLIGDAGGIEALGPHFGAGLYAREIDWLRREEWARSVDDILWRRTKAGLHMTIAQREAVAAYLAR